jgi:hypothetical protein
MTSQKSKQKPSSLSLTDSLIYVLTFPIVWLYNLGMKPHNSTLYRVTYFGIKLVVLGYAAANVLFVIAMIKSAEPPVWSDYESKVQTAINAAECPLPITAEPQYLTHDFPSAYEYISPQVRCNQDWDDTGVRWWECTCKDTN